MNALIPPKLTDVVDTARGMGNLKHMIYYKTRIRLRLVKIPGPLDHWIHHV